MKYIFIDETGIIGFKDDAINPIKEKDVLISEENYQRYMVENSKGKSFKVKDIKGATFESIFEEYTPELSMQPKSEVEILRDKVELMQKALDEMLLGGAF